MSKWICASCDYIYDPTFAFLTHAAAPDTTPEDLPDEWCCPDCGAAKGYFLPLKEDGGSESLGVPISRLAWQRRVLQGAA
jgi:rubredoxin